MEEQKEEKAALLQWHPAFCAGMQIELSDEAEHMHFEAEHMLGSKPMQIDLVIIKINKNYRVQKNIGRIFRTYNIVEYKSPDDYLNIDDFFKVYGYAGFYKSDTKRVDEIKAKDITITFVCQHYPCKLVEQLTNLQGRIIEKQDAGIYYISDTVFPIQLIVQKELNPEENLWLHSITNDLKRQEDIDNLLNAYAMNEHSVLYQSVMNVIIRANRKRMEVVNMCEALMEIMEPYFIKIRQEERQSTKQDTQISLVERLIKIQNFTLSEACALVDITVEEYNTIKKQMVSA